MAKTISSSLQKLLNLEGLEYYHELLVNEYVGTLSESDSKTLEAINDELDGIDTSITTLNGDASTTGSVSKKINDAIDALDSSVSAAAADGDRYSVLTGVTEADGKLSAKTEVKLAAVAKTGNAADVAITDTNSYFTSGTVEGALEELYSQSGSGSAVTVQEVTTDLGNGILKAYKIYQGGTAAGNLKGTINIPKDLVVSSGSIVTGTWSSDTFTEDQTQGTSAGKAIKLVIANQTAPLYINVADLIDIYTEGDGISVSSGNAISVELDSTSENFLSVSSNGLKLSGVQNAIDTAVGNKNVSATGDSYVSASASNNEVTVATNVANLAFTQGSGSTASTLTGTQNTLVKGDDAASKVSSFTNARISEEIAKLGATEGSTTVASGKHVAVQVTQANGKITGVTVTEDNIASASSFGAITAEEIEAIFA